MTNNWKYFFDNRDNKDVINPFWSDINSDHKYSNNQSENLDDLVLALNKRKLTNYLNTVVKPKDDWKEHFPDKDSKQFIETSYAIEALKAMNLFNDFNLKLQTLEWRHGLVNARHYYYFHHITSKLLTDSKKELRVLEIGGGSGTLSIYLRDKLKIAEYFDVDFPEMCLVNYYEQKRYFEKLDETVSFNFFNNNTKIRINRSNQFNISYLEPNNFMKNYSKLGKFDLIINTHSFQEMDRNIRNKYLNICSNLLKKNGYFFHVNWQQSQMSNIDGTKYNNTPLTYPYPPNINLIGFMEDPIGKYMRIKREYKSKTLGYLSIIKKRKFWLLRSLLYQIKIFLKIYS